MKLPISLASVCWKPVVWCHIWYWYTDIQWIMGVQSQFTCFCKSNINQTFTNDGGMIMRSEDCNFHRNQTCGRRIDRLFVHFWNLTASLNKSPSIWISTWMQWGGIVYKYLLLMRGMVYNYCLRAKAWVALCGVKGSMMHKFWFWCKSLHSGLFWGSFFPMDYHCFE